MALQPVMFPEIEGPDFVRSTEVAGVAEDVLRIPGKVGGIGRLHPVARAIADEEIHETYAYARASFGDRSLVSVDLSALAWDDQAGVWREGASA